MGPPQWLLMTGSNLGAQNYFQMDVPYLRQHQS